MRFLLLIFFALSNIAYAQETCCVDEDIAAVFVRHATYSRDWPTDFPLSINEEGFEYIGSQKYSHVGMWTVAWKTDSSPESALNLVLQKIESENWHRMPESGRMNTLDRRGFIQHQVTRPAGESLQFCKDREGILRPSAWESKIGTVVAISHDSQVRGQSCAAMVASMGTRGHGDIGIMGYLPALMLPESIDTIVPGGTGGGGSEAHASMSLPTDIPANDISFHFESQMRDQNWIFESDIQGSQVSGHVWRRTEGDLQLVCIVTAIEIDVGLRLRMYLEAL